MQILGAHSLFILTFFPSTNTHWARDGICVVGEGFYFLLLLNF